MQVDIEGQPSRELVRVERIELEPGALAEYPGTYESEELEVPDGAHSRTVRNRTPLPLSR